MDTGWLTAGSARNIAFAGGFNWLNCNNAKISDDSWSTANLGDHESSNGLNVYNFSAGVSGTINGIEVRVEKKRSGSFFYTEHLYLMDDTVTKGNDKSDGENWSTTEAFQSFGGPTDLWGTSWSAAQVRASTFGCCVSGETGSSPSMGYVDCMQVKIYYTPSSNDHLMIMGM